MYGSQDHKHFSPKNASEFRNWLFENSTKENELWVVFYKKATGKQTVSYKDILDEALCFGWIDSIEKGIDTEKYAIRFTPRTKNSRWSEINVKRYKELLKMGKVSETGKKAFNQKGHIYGSISKKP